MSDYTNIGLTANLIAQTSLGAPHLEVMSALDASLLFQPTPYLNRTAIGKGTLQTNLGGLLQLMDATGGTVLLTADPRTGTITINGGIQAQTTLNLGTITNTTIAGTSTITGTLTNTTLMTGGTYASGTFNNPVIGTPSVTAGTFSSPRVTGTLILDTNAGSPMLGADGAMAIETRTGTAILAVRLSGTTFYFLPAGTLS